MALEIGKVFYNRSVFYKHGLDIKIKCVEIKDYGCTNRRRD